MANPWDRLVAVWYAMRAAMGATLLPVLYPLINKLADAGQTLVRWQTLFPNITRVIGYAVLAVLSFAAAGAVANIVMGVSTFVMMGLRGLWAGLTAVMKIHVGVIWLYNKAVLAWAATMRILRGVLLAVRMASMLTGIAFNFALWPVLLIIVAVAALAAGCYLLYQHWDQIVAAVMQTEAFKTLAAIVQWVGEIFASVWASVVEGWNSVVEFISNFSLMEAMGNMVSGIGNLFSGLWDSLMSSFSSAYGWIVEKLNHIPGVNIDMPVTATSPVVSPSDIAKPPESLKSGNNTLLTGGQVKGIERGGLNKEISNNNKSYTDNSKSFGNITINANKGMTPEQLQEWEELR